MALQPLWTLTAFSVSYSIRSRYDSFYGVSARRKAAICTQDNTNTEETRTDIHAFSEIRNHDPGVAVGEDSSCLRPLGHCDRPIPALGLINYTYPTVGTIKSVSYINNFY
jgi:hypothetical protein